MTNTEKTILEKLSHIEKVLTNQQKQVMTFEEFCDYAGISKSYGYKLTSTNAIGFYRPNGKLIYIEKSEADKFLLQNRVKSEAEIKAESEKK